MIIVTRLAASLSQIIALCHVKNNKEQSIDSRGIRQHFFFFTFEIYDNHNLKTILNFKHIKTTINQNDDNKFKDVKFVGSEKRQMKDEKRVLTKDSKATNNDNHNLKRHCDKKI